MPTTFTDYQIQYRPWRVLSQISGQPSICEADFELAKTVFLTADAPTRAGWIAADYVGERLAVRLMEQSNKVELNRIGKILLTWRGPYTGQVKDAFHRRSETLLRSAIQRCAQSGETNCSPHSCAKNCDTHHCMQNFAPTRQKCLTGLCHAR